MLPHVPWYCPQFLYQFHCPSLSWPLWLYFCLVALTIVLLALLPAVLSIWVYLGGGMVHSMLCCLLLMVCPPFSIVKVCVVLSPLLLGLFLIIVTSFPMMLVISPIALLLLDVGIGWCGFCLHCLPGIVGILLLFIISNGSYFVLGQRSALQIVLPSHCFCLGVLSPITLSIVSQSTGVCFSMILPFVLQ